MPVFYCFFAVHNQESSLAILSFLLFILSFNSLSHSSFLAF
ncbi:hypothetical protein CBFG_02232 [Clostridiales bacterium 1_7_47FAA]|nr:hypothetical protein CBFG_02232 [Clostridiales bacterium 1_7_47FAA]